MRVIRDVLQRRRVLLVNKEQERQLQWLVDLFKQSETFDESAIVRRLIGLRTAHGVYCTRSARMPKH